METLCEEAFVYICAERVSSLYEALRGPMAKRRLRTTDPKEKSA